jgi:hypothetical protein
MEGRREELTELFDAVTISESTPPISKVIPIFLSWLPFVKVFLTYKHAIDQGLLSGEISSSVLG